jgi:protoporphyrinogen oxidase
MPEIVILGTGMAGCGAIHRLHAEGIVPTVYDKASAAGGLTSSLQDENGLIFDIGPHISFTQDQRIQQLFADSVDHQYQAVEINLNNYWRGHWPGHPVQLHLHGLPDDVIVRVIEDFVASHRVTEPNIRNYDDWLVASFGRAFADLFPGQYTRKYHTTTPANMTTDWLGPRLYRPSLAEVLRGALSAEAPTVHYITQFRYPTHGGFVSYLCKFLPLGNLRLKSEAIAIDAQTREVHFSDGTVSHYDALISSIPLPELIRIVRGVPPDVVAASRDLACSSCVLVNIGVDRRDLSREHVTYFYDEDICFSRVHFPHMLSAGNAPAGKAGIQAEVYFSSKYKPLAGAPEDCIEPVIRDLRRCGILHDDDTILSRTATFVRYANVIFDHDRPEALRTVHGFLDDTGLIYCGRHGDWGYLWTDESFKSGERAAETALTKLSTSV